MIKKLGYSFAAMISLAGAMPTPAQEETRCDIAAYVWPAYQPDARFKDIGVFKEGKGEWEAVYHARPKFAGHNQPHVPLWGYTNEADPKVVATKIDAAVSHGVSVFIYDWYWYDGKPFLEDALNEGFLKAANSNEIKFYLMWANHDHTSYLDYTDPDKTKTYWHGAVDRVTFDTLIAHVIKDYFSRPNYYKINGEPVFSIYEISTFIQGMGSVQKAKEALEYFTQKTKEAGFPGLHLQGVLWAAIPANLSDVPGDTNKTQNKTVLELGLKSLTNYQWCHYVPLDEYRKWGDKAVEGWQEFSREFTVPFLAHVSINWDPNPRYPGTLQGMVTNANPTDFKAFLQDAKAYVEAHPQQPRLITINAWNEWAEGSYLEPDQQHGYDYLEAVEEVFGAQR